MASAALLLHPVRLRIVQAFLGDRALTTAELAAELPDVPPGSLYRHVARLAREGILQVVAERQVRGARERTYCLRLAAAQVTPQDAAAMTIDEHQQAFTAFVAGLLGQFDRYLGSDGADPARDPVGYRLAALWLTDDELRQLLADLVAVLQPRLAQAPGRGRRRLLLAGILLPAPTPPRGARRGRRPNHRPSSSATGEASRVTEATAVS